MQHFLDLDEGDKTIIGDRTVEVTGKRHSAASVTLIAQDGDDTFDIVIDARDESVQVIPWKFE